MRCDIARILKLAVSADEGLDPSAVLPGWHLAAGLSIGASSRAPRIRRGRRAAMT
jgi:hypothetical protein